MFHRAEGIVSARTDVDNSWAPGRQHPQPGATYFDTYDWEYTISEFTPERLAQIRRLTGSPKRRLPRTRAPGPLAATVPPGLVAAPPVGVFHSMTSNIVPVTPLASCDARNRARRTARGSENPV